MTMDNCHEFRTSARGVMGSIHTRQVGVNVSRSCPIDCLLFFSVRGLKVFPRVRVFVTAPLYGLLRRHHFYTPVVVYPPFLYPYNMFPYMCSLFPGV